MKSLTLTTANGARAEIVLQGAHVTSWRPANSVEDHLFVSERARYEPGVAIRGGVPVIFPQFADQGPLVKHGFARVSQWHQHSYAQLDNGRAQAVLTLASDDNTRQLWPCEFAARYTVTLSDQRLEMQLQITNTGTDSFEFTTALHTYLAVGDIKTTRLYGLQGSQYLDKTNEQKGMQTESREVALFRNAVDRIYRSPESPLVLKSPTQQTKIQGQGFEDIVIWNPWAEGSKSIEDMVTGDYQRMLCVESATVINPIHLTPNKSWTGRQILESL